MADIRNQMEQQSVANTQLTITVHNLAQTVQALALSVEDIRQGLQRPPHHPIQQGQSSQFPPPSNSSPGIPPPSHRSPGLKHELQQDLLLAKPTSLEEAFSLAKTYESKYELLLSTPKWASRPTAVSIPHRPYSNHQPPIRPTTVTMPQPPQRPSPTATTGRPIPDLPVRRLSAAEIRDKRSKGLCYNYDKNGQILIDVKVDF
nr:Transposon Ty3-G Gag-Pol polyprotein [Ipomoea batatas]